MNQRDFNRAVAKATGESAETIARRGFVLLTPVPVDREPQRADYDAFLESATRPTHLSAKSPATA
jgi:hypothetical protein